MLPQLTDFGFAESVHGTISVWRGTDFHISPEMQELKDSETSSNKCHPPEVTGIPQDMYSLGVILFTLFFGT
jgi:serine/threonine protein kinase